MDLLPEGRSISLEEGIHILPAIQVPNPTNFGIDDRLGGITSPITKDKTLDMGGLDLAAVVNDISCGRNHNLGCVETG